MNAGSVSVLAVLAEDPGVPGPRSSATAGDILPGTSCGPGDENRVGREKR